MARYVSYRDFDWVLLGFVLVICSLGVMEIRIHAGGEFRVLYVAKFPEAIYVLHAFEKRTRRTRHVDLNLARGRCRQLRADRAEP